MTNRGTFSGNMAEIEFVKRFNSSKNHPDFNYYFDKLKIIDKKCYYMCRVTKKQYSKLSEQYVMTRADAYLIKVNDNIEEILKNNDDYLDEDFICEKNINYSIVEYSGISIKMNDSSKFQILKLTPNSFYKLFDEYELGAGASIYCLHEDELEKNESVYQGWKTTEQKVISKYENQLPELKELLNNIDLSQKLNIYKALKNFSNRQITNRIIADKHLQEIIFNGYHIYEEPYSASYFYKGNKIEKLEYIPFNITTGSGRSKGIFTIVLKPKKQLTI